jgi:hypothetical protein
MKLSLIRTKKTVIVALAFILTIGSVPFTLTQEAAAQSCDTLFYSSNDVLYYDPCDTCSTSGASLLGSSNEEKVFKWFRAKGLSAAATAGILGNINTESSFNPFRMQTTYSSTGLSAVLPIEAHAEYNKAFGLVQWDGGRRQEVLKQMSQKFPDYEALINAHGKSADGYKEAPPEKNDAVLTFSLEYVDLELSKGYTRVYDAIKAVSDDEAGVREATEIWNRRYEVSGDYSQDRHNKAVEYYNQFKDAVIPSVDTDSGGCESGVPAGEVVHYSQTDPRWKDVGFAGGTIGPIGCGPTSMAIILASLVDKTITPPDVAAVAGEQQGGTSSHANLIRGVNEKWGLNIDASGMSFDQAVEFVKSGKGYVWVGGAGAPPFTKGGHLVAMVGVAEDGQITIADPFDTGAGHQKISNYPAAQIAADGGAFYGVPKK